MIHYNYFDKKVLVYFVNTTFYLIYNIELKFIIIL